MECAAKRQRTLEVETTAPVPPTCGRVKRLSGKVILCTGGTQGCGENILHACAEEGAEGLVFCGRQESLGQAVQAALEAKGCQALYVKADLASAEDVANVLSQADKKFGRLDGLVNAAASTERGDWVGDNKADVAHMDNLYRLNFRAPFLLLQGAAEIMIREKTGGSIVNIGSINGHGEWCASRCFPSAQLGQRILLELVRCLPSLRHASHTALNMPQVGSRTCRCTAAQREHSQR